MASARVASGVGLTQEVDLYRSLSGELDRVGHLVRATIVRVWGSTPREVGAKMLILPDGTIRGTVGGGCGEAEVWQEAKELLASGDLVGTRLVHVDLTEGPESDNGKVCGGRFDVFLDQWAKDGPEFAGLAEALSSPQDKAWITYLGPDQPPSWKKASGEVAAPLSEFTVGGHLLVDCARPSPALAGLEGLVEAARQALRQLRSRTQVVEGQAFFIDVLGSPPDLVIAGAGHIARPLCELATIIGFRVVIVDDRPEYVDPAYFPRAGELVCDDFSRAFASYPWSPRSHVVLVTRGHKHDENCLRQLIGKDLAYIGMIGSKRRTRAVLGDLAREGVSRDWLGRIFAPIGLDIGAETPEEIAICILAEMICLRRGGKAASMRGFIALESL